MWALLRLISPKVILMNLIPRNQPGTTVGSFLLKKTACFRNCEVFMRKQAFSGSRLLDGSIRGPHCVGVAF